MPLIGRILFTVSGLALPVGAHLADYNETHMFNPRWPPHARFHDAQSLLMAIVLGASTIYFAWRPMDDRRTTVVAAAGVSALYWLSQGLSILYPGTAFFDPEFDVPSSHILGLPGQIPLELLFLMLTGAAAWFACRPSTDAPAAAARVRWARREPGARRDDRAPRATC